MACLRVVIAATDAARTQRQPLTKRGSGAVKNQQTTLTAAGTKITHRGARRFHNAKMMNSSSGSHRSICVKRFAAHPGSHSTIGAVTSGPGRMAHERIHAASDATIARGMRHAIGSSVAAAG